MHSCCTVVLMHTAIDLDDNSESDKTIGLNRFSGLNHFRQAKQKRVLKSADKEAEIVIK